MTDEQKPPMTAMAERARAVVKAVRDHELFNVPTDALWEREIAAALRAALFDTVPIADFVELLDTAASVNDGIRMHADHAEYVGGMNAIEDLRETLTELRWKHADRFPDLDDTP